MGIINKIKEVDFVLTNKSGKEELITILDNKEYSIDFASEDQTNLRNFFMAVLNELKKEKFHFKYLDLDEVKNDMIKKVAEKYINEINREIDSILVKIDDVKNKSGNATSNAI